MDVHRRVIFCLPGRSYSSRFLQQWSDLLITLMQSQKYEFKISNHYSSFVSFARAKCLGASVDRGPQQKPFNGQLDYDVLVWIDSDIVFNTQQVLELIESTDVYPVVSGIYMMEDGKHFACVKDLDKDHFLRHGSYPFLTPDSMQQYIQATGSMVMPCGYAGMGFMAMRKGVLEQLNYPWFYRPPESFSTPPEYPVREWVDICSEDVALCRNLIDKGIVSAIVVKLNLRVGHEKTLVL